MKFENNKSGNGGVLTLNNEVKEVGRLTYTIFPEDHKLIISFVLVHPEFEGRGMGKYLVEEAIKFARENNWKVYPHCSYARAVMMRMNDVEDIFLNFNIFDLGYILNGLDDWSIRAVYIILTFPVYIYPVVLESLMEGQTPGKKLMKIKVVKIDGYQASFGDYMIRWVFRIIDVSFAGVIGLISMIVSKNNQRLGDIASGTAVISLKNNINISHTILENIHENYIPSFPQVIALSDNDMRIIKDNYTKALKVDDRQIISKLSDKIKSILKLEIDSTKMTERQFIGIIIKDYNYYTGKE